MQAYCVKCRTKREIKDAKSITMKNGKPATQGICPVCGQGFDPGIRTCPQHSEELIPAALYMAKREAQPRPTKKICPVCGSQYEGNVEFCGTDGATLVPIN